MSTIPSPPLWTNATGPLIDFASELGFEPSKSFNELPDELSFHTEQFKTQKFKLSTDSVVKTQQLTAFDVVMRALKEKYGPSLTLNFKLGEEKLEIHQGYTSTELEAFWDYVADSSFELELRINKRKLASHWGLVAAGVNFKIFLFPAALERALSLPLRELESSDNSVLKGFSGQQKLIILVPDYQPPVPNAKLELNGDYLTVLGGASVANWEQYLPSPNVEERLCKVKDVYAEAGKNLRWVNIQLDYLTPLHLKVDWKKPNGGPDEAPAREDLIARPLFAQLLSLSLLYTAHESLFPKPADANSAQNGNSSWMATFDADTFLARVEAGETSKIVSTLVADNVTNPWQACKTLASVAEWIYKEGTGVANRIEVVQVAVASFLQDTPPANNLSQLVQRASEIYERIEQRWNNFIGEKLQKFFAHIKELESAVELTTNAYDEQLQALTKTLTDNMLAAVAVVVGSFLAAILKTPFQPYVFLFGTLTYLGYLLVFPFLIGMLSGWQRFADSKAAFKERQEDFSRRLTPKEVKDIVGQRVTNKEARFKTWFDVTVLSYTAILVIMVAAIIWLPRAIEKWTDDFKLTDVEYGALLPGGIVPMTIRGENFHKDSEIVVNIGSRTFTNTGEESLKVYGSSVLKLSPRRQDLAEAIEKNSGIVTVRQGSSAEKRMPLPGSPPESPDPVFGRWSWVAQRKGGIATASGSNLKSIAEISLNGVKLDFQVSNDGRNIELRGLSAVKDLQAGKLTATLTDGRQIPIAVNIGR
jgi:hypothetical protein